MADIFTKKRRSEIMALISSKETKPEVLVRSFLFNKGFRFRKNVKKLPGKPDIVLAKYKTVVFVHGCFWHAHTNCNKATKPKSNIDFWEKKIGDNVERDKKVTQELQKLNWQVIEVWECELKKTVFEKTMFKIIEKIVANY
jgi:DNA mismatch endonuclease (patch repair protein)